MPRYFLFLYDHPSDFAGLSPQEMERIIGRYRAWADRLRSDGTLVDGQKLKDGEGRVLSAREGGLRVLDGPYSETKEVIGGYFALQVADYEAAVAIAEGCPHLEYGGTIEIRQVDEVG